MSKFAAAQRRYMDVLELYNHVVADAWILRQRPVWSGWVETFVELQNDVAEAKARMDEAEREEHE